MQFNHPKVTEASFHAKGRQQIVSNMAMLVTAFFWGISFISTKVVLRELPPSTIGLVRFVIASLFLAILLHKLEPGSRPKKADLPFLALSGILGISLYFFFENTGINYTSAVNASLIVTFVPLITILLDTIFFRSRITALKLVGIALAIVGTYLSVTANGQISFDSAHFKGNLYMVGAMVVWALYTLNNKFLQGKYSGLSMTTFQTMFGTIGLIPLALIEIKQWQLVSLISLWHILFLAICCSVLGYLFYNYALKRLDVTVTTIYLNLIPVFGVAGGYVFLDERVLPVQLIGGSITLLAIIVVNLEVISFVKRQQVQTEAEGKA